MTERLYYSDAYLTDFSACVTECTCEKDRFFVRLDRSAFYPTSGGQPFDTGTLGGKNVLDVFVDEAGDVVHVLDGEVAVGETVECKIDWQRRFDHMQQHAGEHMIAGALFRRLKGHTIGLHLGHDVSTIDVELPGGEMHIPSETLRAIEEDVNEKIHKNAPIKCWFPTPEELPSVPLRKPPTVLEHVRVVAMGDFEYCACGGTHPRSTGEIGLVKILDARPNRGKVRVSFVCGMRAFRDYAFRFEKANMAAESLSTGVEDLPEAVLRLQENLRQTRWELNEEKRKGLFRDVPEMLRNARDIAGVKAVSRVVDADMDLLRELAAKLTASANVVALLAAPNGKGGFNLVFSRADGVEHDMGRLLSQSARPLGGKGGGKPDFAQGAGPEETLSAAEKLLAESL